MVTREFVSDEGVQLSMMNATTRNGEERVKAGRKAMHAAINSSKEG